MAITHQNGCDSNLVQPVVGSATYTTANANVNGQDVQYSVDGVNRITVPTAQIPINKCTIDFKYRFEYDAIDGSGFRGIIGKYASSIGINGDWMLESSKTDGAIGLFIKGSISAITWNSPTILAMYNDGNLHDIKLVVDNTAPVKDGSHIILYIDGELQPITANDRTTSWTALTNVNDVHICNAGFYPGDESYVEDIVVQDIAVPIPAVEYNLTYTLDPAVGTAWKVGAAGAWNASGDSEAVEEGAETTVYFQDLTNYATPIPQTFTMPSENTSKFAIYDSDPYWSNTTLKYNCDGGAFQKGTKVSETTSTESLYGRTVQLSDTAGEKITVPASEVDINFCTIEFDFEPDYAFDASSGIRAFFGKWSLNLGITGDWMLCTSATDGSLYLFTKNIIGNVQWLTPDVLAMYQKGSLTSIRLVVDNVNPVNGSSHVALYLNGVLQTVTSGDRTTPWTSVTNANDVLIGDANYNGGTSYLGPMYYDNIRVLNTTDPIPEITVNETNQRLYPYDDNEQSGVINCNGTYKNVTPASVEVRVYQRSNNATVAVGGNDWNTPSGLTVSGGMWSGTITGVPKTNDWLGIEARYSDETGVTGKDSIGFGVGYIAALHGQSNAEKMFTVGTGTPSDLTVMLAHGATTGRDWITPIGSGAIALANELTTALSCPVGLINGGYGSNSLEEKNDLGEGWFYTGAGLEQADYTQFITAVDAIGGKINHLFWYQGESDAVGDPSTYQAIEALYFANQIRTDIANAKTGTLPVTVSLLGRWGITSTDAKWATANKAKLNNFDAGVFQYITTPVDQDFTGDDAHMVASGYVTYAGRIARAMLTEEGVYTTYRSPRAIGYNIVSDVVTDVFLDLDLDTDTTDNTDSFSVDIGAGLVNVTGTKTTPLTVRLTHPSGTVQTVASMYGKYSQTAPTANILKGSTSGYPILQDSDIPVATETVTLDSNWPSGAEIIIDGVTYTEDTTIELGVGDYAATPNIIDGYTNDGVQNFSVVIGTPVTVTLNYTIIEYIITVSSGLGGSISPLTLNIEHGSNRTFTITPDDNYHILDVIVDSVSVGAVTSYDFIDVTAAHTISASFEIDTFTITPTAGNNGSISPAIATDVNYGSNQTFTITPNMGYHIDDVLVNGISQGAVGSYEFTDVTTDQTISATFIQDTVETETVTLDSNWPIGSEIVINGVTYTADAVIELEAGDYVATPNTIAGYVNDGVQNFTVVIGEPITITINYSIPSTGGLTDEERAHLMSLPTVEQIWAYQNILTKLDFLFHIGSGKWEIVNNQMIIYEADNETEVARFDLFDQNSRPAITNVLRRERI